MVSPAYPLQSVVLSPCVGVCELRADGLCAGCGRSVAEIAAWSTMDDAARLRVRERLVARGDA